MTNPGTRVQPRIPEPEKWWERVGRMIGGWGLVAFTLAGKIPVLSSHEGSSLWVEAAHLVFSLALIALGVGVAHSTVFKIVADTAGKFVTVSGDAVRSVRFRNRRGKGEDNGTRIRSSDTYNNPHEGE